MKISAVTLFTRDMACAVEFYQRLGLTLHRGGADASFSSFALEAQHLNLRQTSSSETCCGGCLVIMHVLDVNQFYRQLLKADLQPDFSPQDAAWGERYFHIHDPDGNLLSFATPFDQLPASR